MIATILPDYTQYPLSALVEGREQTQQALNMGHAGGAANNMWRECLRRIDEQLVKRGFVLAVDEAHEQALREDERRWAAEQVAHIAADDGEIIADLLIRVRRNWRLSREHRTGEYATFKKHSQWAGNAASELEAEYGVEVAWTIADGWVVNFEAGWTESETDD